jgi:hypothetical protein
MSSKRTRRVPAGRAASSPLTNLARTAVARSAAIEALPGMPEALSRQLVRTALDDARRKILAGEPASIEDAVIKLRGILFFTYDRIVSERRREEMDDVDADLIIGSLHDVIGFLVKAGNVRSSIAGLRI